MADVCRILYVEDHADTAAVVSRMLSADGFGVTTVGNASEALEACEREQFDLLLCDIGLPGMDGLEVMRHVREQYGLPGIAFSAYGQEDDVRRGLEAGFSEYMVKPVQFWRLSEAVRRILEEEDCALPPGRAWPVEREA